MGNPSLNVQSAIFGDLGQNISGGHTIKFWLKYMF